MATEKKKRGACPRYKCKEEIEQLIEDYFKNCKGTALLDDEGQAVLGKNGLPVIVDAKPPTVNGLALALGFNSRISLLNYQAKAEFTNTITRAKTLIEEYAERRLFDRDGFNGAKFSLINNFKGWSDKHSDIAAEDKLLDDPLTKSIEEAINNGIIGETGTNIAVS